MRGALNRRVFCGGRGGLSVANGRRWETASSCDLGFVVHPDGAQQLQLTTSTSFRRFEQFIRASIFVIGNHFSLLHSRSPQIISVGNLAVSLSIHASTLTVGSEPLPLTLPPKLSQQHHEKTGFFAASNPQNQTAHLSKHSFVTQFHFNRAPWPPRQSSYQSPSQCHLTHASTCVCPPRPRQSCYSWQQRH